MAGVVAVELQKSEIQVTENELSKTVSVKVAAPQVVQPRNDWLVRSIYLK